MVVRSPDATRSVKLLGLVENKRADSELPFLNHNGIDVLTESEVDQAGKGHWSRNFKRPEETRTT